LDCGAVSLGGELVRYASRPDSFTGQDSAFTLSFCEASLPRALDGQQTTRLEALAVVAASNLPARPSIPVRPFTLNSFETPNQRRGPAGV
jgi:hypothetical protein